jgi:D-xylonolactonase
MTGAALSRTRIRTIQAGPFALGEGPIWHAGALWWIDILAPAIHRCGLDGGDLRTWPMPRPIGCIAPHRDGLLAGLEDGVHLFTPATGGLLRLAPHTDPGCRLNDGKVAPDGRFLVGGMSYAGEPSARLFALNGGRLEPLVERIGCSNGLAWSADGRTMYYIDTATRSIEAFAYRDGRLSDRRTIHVLSEGWPDGMTIDTEGQLWVAVWDGGCVLRLDPASGAQTARIDLPARRPTCPVFAGPDLDVLVVTTARTGLAEPAADDGAMLALAVGCRGLPAAIATS